ncbi:hypothetical protein LTR37_004032 [Vermiconidia calcicola]|uniref:Uncharacterized protein n=1 Tax=Vermiconidia calcicola TaxID=1690605 RepID=A0ACC3NP82_9PEZI|nr:hypothetical protein LTR37_004032 [Vermiconidia calcicola]
MSGHNYGIPAGYRDGSPAKTGAASSTEEYNSQQSHQLQDYSRSPSRRPVAPYSRQPGGPTDLHNTPTPPPHYQIGGNSSYAPYRAQSSTTPEEDNYGTAAAAGGLGALAGGVAETRPRESGVQAMRGVDTHYGDRGGNTPYGAPMAAVPQRPLHQTSDSQSSLDPFHDGSYTPSQSQYSGLAGSEVGYGYGYDQSMPGGRQPYNGDGYDEYMDPRNIADDGDDGLADLPKQRRSRFGGGGATAGAGAGTTAGGAGVLKTFGSHDPSGSYGPVSGSGKGGGAEKSEWLKSQSSGRKRTTLIVAIIGLIIIIGAIVGGVVYAILRKSGGGDSGGSRGSSDDSNGLWDIDSSQVKAVLNNKNLHKVFPGMDYTPLNAQYPACLSNPPYQNDVTLDVAVLAQLTPAIRLYGTDCKQTEQVLKGIDLLGYNDTVKVWLGVWLGDNSTTNTRQLNQMYTILDSYPASHFAGVIVGNEVLYREDITITQLANEISKVKAKLAEKGVSLPVATSDLGDDWTPALAADSDIVMANVHPFFAGKRPGAAPDWTLDFWQTHNVILKDSTNGPWPANIISETGWPSEGGNSCGTGAKCPTKTEGSVAGIDELNEFMDGWVCPRLAAGTTYFWFEAFDEPWKEQFDDPKIGNFWEPHWGLLDVDRNLKSGLKIPDCNGQTIDTPY